MVDGVFVVEHTADLAMGVEAESLPQLFNRAALGMLALIERDDLEAKAEKRDRQPWATSQQREIELQAQDLPALLVRWLREILYLHQAHRLAYRGAEFQVIHERRLRARLHLEPDAYAAVRAQPEGGVPGTGPGSAGGIVRHRRGGDPRGVPGRGRGGGSRRICRRRARRFTTRDWPRSDRC
jgi:SHS2 domain-containing protein